MAKGNNTLLIFDFDNTITNGHMHGVFFGRHSGIKKSDFNSAVENAVTDHNIKDFLKNTDGIKNEEGLKSTLQSALSNGIEVNIASYTGYPNAVKRVVENHLGLSKEQADSISVFGGFPADYDNELPKDLKEQQSQVGKNLHICKAIVNYKNNHNGQLPKTVMLVDDSAGNIKKINEFVESMSKRGGWLKENGLSIEEIQKIKFEGARVPKEDKNVGYLERVQEFVNANLVQEPIYENLKKEEPIYQNLQGIHGSSSEKELSPPLPPKKRKSSDGIVVDDENKKPAHTQTFSLAQEFKAIKLLFKEYGQKIVDAICNLFKKEVITKIEGEGYNVNSKENEGIVVRGSKPIDAQKINKYIASSLTETMVKNKENIKSLGNNYKGKQLEQKALESLEGNLQKKDVNSNYNDGEPIFQTREEASNYPPQKKDINSNSVRGNYNDGESIFQTVQEARNYHRQKKGIDSNPVSKKPLAPPVPPKNYTERVIQSRNIEGIGRNK